MTQSYSFRLSGRKWLLFGVLCSLVVLGVVGTTTFLAAHAAGVQPNVTAPRSTTSYYESSTNSTTLYNQGCQASKGAAGLVVLDFGEPYSLGSGSYGTYDFGSHVDSDTAIFHAAANFALGAWKCRPSSSHLVTVAIGTSNYGSHVSSAAGKAWGKMVNDAEAYVTSQKYTSAVSIIGASDMETEWNSFTVTSNFVKGYNSATKRALVDYGDDTPGHWSAYDVWYVSSGAGAQEEALPEIYYNADATQDWAAVAKTNCSAGRKLRFVGAMAEAVKGTNSPSAAFTALYNALGTNSCTKADRSTMKYTTDI